MSQNEKINEIMELLEAAGDRELELIYAFALSITKK